MTCDGATGKDNVSLNVSQSSPDDDHGISYPDSAVAVVGFACRFAGADTAEQLWQILENGISQCADLPQDRFPDSRFERRAWKKAFKANVIDNVDVFDHKFFNIPSREATFMDPQQRIALEVMYQALESAGWFACEHSEAERDIGCYMAACTNEYQENVATHPPSAFSLTGSIRPFIAGKLSHHFGFTGPAIMYDTACAASGTAIHAACRAVSTGECDGAVAGGTNIFVSPDTFQNLAAGHFTSTTGASKSFDISADGYCRGEGVAIVVLKRLADALRDGDTIRGVIAATAVNQNANETFITIPHGPSQMKLYRKALRLAQLEPQDISYVEAHGTGTSIGDPIEANSIRAVFGSSSRSKGHQTYLGSLKSNIGHAEASSGVSGLIKVLMMMQKGVIPQQALFTALNPDIPPLEPDGIAIPTTNVAWEPKFKAACVNNYGASGTNAVMVVTEPPKATSKPDSEKTIIDPAQIGVYPISISAFSLSSLKSYCIALLDLVSQAVATEDLIENISFHLSRRRNPDLPFTVSTTVSSLQDLKDFLRSTVNGESHRRDLQPKPVVLFFGGQTGKTASVPRALYESCPIFRKHLDDCDAAMRSLGSPSIFPAIFEPERPNVSVLAHSTLFSAQYARAMAWLDCGLKPTRLIGHSFGQLTALCISGVLSLRDALILITERARLIQENWGADAGSMIAIEATLEDLHALLTKHSSLGLQIACHNGPRSFVVAGHTSAVDTLQTALESSVDKPRYRRLSTSNAFHSSLSDPLIQPLQDIAAKLEYHSPGIPLETCSEHRPWSSISPSLVASHTREPVYFHQAVERISKQLGPSTWLEVGSGCNMPMLRRALGTQASTHDVKSLKLESASTFQSLAEATSELWQSGYKVQFWPFHPSQQIKYKMLNLPPYQFDKARHWLEWKDHAPSTADIKTLVSAPEPEALLRFVRDTGDGGEFHINTQLDSWQKACAGNQILGVPACPLSFLLEVLIEAIDTIQKTPGRRRNIHCLQRLEVQSTILAEPPGGVTLTVEKASASQTWRFRFLNTHEPTRSYTSGTVSPLSGFDQQHISDFARFERLLDISNIKVLIDDAEADSVRGKAIYKSLANSFHFDKSSQYIKGVSARGNEAAALLALPRNAALNAMENLVRVPLICLNVLQDRQAEDIFVNTKVGDARFADWPNPSSGEDISWIVHLKFAWLGVKDVICDIFVFDARTERLSAVILDATFSRAPSESSHELAPSDSFTYPEVPASHDLPTFEIHLSDESDLPLEISRQPPDRDDIMAHSTGLPDLRQALFGLLVRVADVDIDVLHDETMIDELGIDSLMGMEVADEINKAFSTDVEFREFLNTTDVGSLCRLIASRAAGFSYGLAVAKSASSVSQNRDTVLSNAGMAPTDTDLSSCQDEPVAKPHPARISVPETKPSDSIWSSFASIRTEFGKFAKQTGGADFWPQVYPAQRQLVSALITEAFAQLGCDLSTLHAGSPVPQITHQPKHARLVQRLLQVLSDDGLITPAAADGWRRTAQAYPRTAASERFRQIQADFPQFAPEHKLLQLAGSGLAATLSGAHDPLQLLFGSAEKRQIMADQYSSAPIQAAVSRQLAAFIGAHAGAATTASFRVLEIGGGTCGTTRYALEALASACPGLRPSYTFTDISPSFVAAARRELAPRYAASVDLEFRTLDISASQLPPELLGCYDLIIATNVLHATPDACASARNARRLLRSSDVGGGGGGGAGVLALVEYTRRLPILDVVFGQLEGWWAFDDGRDHAILLEKEWVATLRKAGFERVDWTRSLRPDDEIVQIFLAG